MGLQYRRRVPLRKGRAWLNLSGSGVSASVRAGRITANTRGGFWVRLARGLFYRGSWK